MPESGPARVLTAARKLAALFYKKWRALKGDINQHVIEEDALALADGGVDHRQQFVFRTDAQKLSEFQAWLDEQIREGVVEPVGARQTRLGGHYTAPFIRRAYKTGTRDAGTRLREKGVEPIYSRDELEAYFNLPVSTNQLATLYTRTFSELEGVGDDASQKMSRKLSEGLSQGWNPRRTARELNEVVDDVAINRSRTIARTETARSYNHASLLRYSRNGIEQVKITNNTPCSQCERAIDKNPYDIDEAMGVLPVHPNCRCAWSTTILD